MGDHRFTIKIEMEFHGVKDNCDMNLNFSDDGDGIDTRVKEFLQGVHERGMMVYNQNMADSYAERDKEKIEREEKTLLAKLSAKYKTE